MSIEKNTLCREEHHLHWVEQLDSERLLRAINRLPQLSILRKWDDYSKREKMKVWIDMWIAIVEAILRLCYTRKWVNRVKELHVIRNWDFYLHSTKPGLVVVKAATFADVRPLNGSRQQLHCGCPSGRRRERERKRQMLERWQNKMLNRKETWRKQNKERGGSITRATESKRCANVEQQTVKRKKQKERVAGGRVAHSVSPLAQGKADRLRMRQLRKEIWKTEGELCNDSSQLPSLSPSIGKHCT